jgi:hypothetical protein
MNRAAWVLTPFLVVLCACGNEVGRVPLAGEGTATTVSKLAAGEVAFWTDIDIEYEGDASLTYDVVLEQDGKAVAKTTCDPLARLSTKVSWVETNIGSKHSRRGKGKMACTATVPAAGQTTAKVTLAFGAKPKTVSLKRADLVLKQ